MSASKPRVLCVDDDSAVLKSLERILSPNFSVALAKDLKETRVLVAREKFAIVIVDQSLPDGKGIEFLSELSSTDSEAIRVLISGQIDPVELSKSINSGILHRLIIKPWDNDYILVQMLEALQSHKLLLEKNALARLAITDPITELNNHRRFQDALKIEVQRSQRHERPVSLLMIDIDHFKNYNDQYGHPAGDRLLADLSKRIVASVRTLDIVARYGGEEFAVIMPDTIADDALRVAERIRLAVADEAFAVFHSPEKAKITVSIGVASLKPNFELVEEADKALYKAKNSGRNRSLLAE